MVSGWNEHEAAWGGAGIPWMVRDLGAGEGSGLVGWCHPGNGAAVHLPRPHQMRIDDAAVGLVSRV